MKSAINGTRYDTNKSILIGTAMSAGMTESGYTSWEVSLYRMPQSRRYFLAGSGGGLTRFYDRAGSLDAGERIIPVTEADAYSWSLAHLEPEDIYESFPHLRR